MSKSTCVAWSKRPMSCGLYRQPPLFVSEASQLCDAIGFRKELHQAPKSAEISQSFPRPETGAQPAKTLVAQPVARSPGSKHDGARMFREGLDGTDGRTSY